MSDGVSSIMFMERSRASLGNMRVFGLQDTLFVCVSETHFRVTEHLGI